MNSLLHGDFLGALDYNPIFIGIFPFLVLSLADEAYFTVTGKRKLSYKVSKKAGWTFAAIIIIFGILRNLPFYPFSILAP